MSKEDLRQQAAISVLNSLLETTQHSVVEALAIRDVYAKVAVLYADSLMNALDMDPQEIMKHLIDKGKADLIEGMKQELNKP